MRGLPAIAGLVALLASCNGTTGDELITFRAYASGAADASAPFVVNGFSVQLTHATMFIGGVYVNESPLATGAESPICITPGIYAAQVPGPVLVDLLDPQPQQFSVFGNGSADTGLSWQIWLTDGDVNETNTTPIVNLQGVATRSSDQQPFPFGAVITINSNRLPPTSDPAQPGLNPICKQRIVLIGGIDIRFFQGGALQVTVDPRPWFNLLSTIDFSALPLTTDDSCVAADPSVAIDPAVVYGSPVCVAAASDGTCPANSQLDPSACTTSTPCEIPKRCIPDTNFATGPGAQEGVELFQGVAASGSAAYSIEYTEASP